MLQLNRLVVACFAGLGVVGCGLESVARASDDVANVTWTSRVGDWHFAAAHDGHGLRGFLVHSNPDTVSGDNIRMIWFPTAPSEADPVLAWKVLDKHMAASWLAATGRVEGTDWMFEFVDPGDGWVAPHEMRSGMFASDPLLALVERSPDPAALLENLAAGGLGAAPMLSAMSFAERAGKKRASEPAPIASLLSAVTAAAESALAIEGDDGDDDWDPRGYCAGCSVLTAVTLPSAWTCTITTVGSAVHCSCWRTQTRCHYYSGLEFWGCDPCPLNNYCETRTQYGDTTLLTSDEPCPPVGGPATVWPWGPWTVPE